jgi:hypothetical protein
VGGNRVENMTVDQIAQAFHSGHLNVRTPLWPPGTTGWQALGNFEQFQMMQPAHAPAGYAQQAGLSQFEEADDDPTRMWTGGGEFDLPGMEGMNAQIEAQHRPMARTGPRQVVPSPRPAPMPPPPAMASRPAPTASLPPSRAMAAPASVPPQFRRRGNGLLLVAGLVGLVGLGSAVLAARGNWGNSSANETASTEVAAEKPAADKPAAEAPATPPSTAPEAPSGEASDGAGQARLAKYEDTSAFVAGDKAAEKAADAPKSAEAEKTSGNDSAEDGDKSDQVAKGEAAGKDSDEDEHETKSTKSSKSRADRSDDAPSKRVSSRSTPKRAKSKAAPARAAHVEKAERAEKAEKPEKAETAEASEPKQAPASAAVNEAAATALANSANLASSCRPSGGPSGQGKARVIYSNDGQVQSVEILTAKFRDTLTGSCVRMVFRRAKIPAFKGEPPTFIKSFTIPEE